MEDRPSLVRRIRARLGALVGVSALEAKVDEQRAQLAELAAAHDRTAQAANHGVVVAGDAAHDATTATAMARRALDGTEQLPSILARLHELDRRVGQGERLAAIVRTTAWLELLGAAPPADELTISIVTPTFDRVDRLQRAVATVRSQSHPRWELLVGDDGSADDTPKVLDALAADDERIHGYNFEHQGGSAVRNRLLAEATGDVIVYLDDDNLMAPGWLRAVAWCFTEHPEVDVAYGARLVDDPARLWGDGTTADPALPAVQFEPYRRDALEAGNFVDMGCLAHRRGLAEASFDEQLHRLADWDLVLRLTAERTPFELPALAIGYLTDAPGRRSAAVDEDPEAAIVRAKLASGPASAG
jgi:hypothetical protein